MPKGEVVELHALPLENRAHACRMAMRRLEAAITEVAEAIVEYEDAQAAFVAAVDIAETGTSCSLNTVRVASLPEVVAEKLAELRKGRG